MRMESSESGYNSLLFIKAMDDIWVVMTPFGHVVTVILVVHSYVPQIFERWSSNRVIEPNVQGGSDF